MGWYPLNRAEPPFKLTLPGLCGLILATTVVTAGLDAVQHGCPFGPAPLAMRTAIREDARALQSRAVPGRSQDKRHTHVARPAWVKRVGRLRLVKWGDIWSQSETDRTARETVILRDARGRAVARIAGQRVDIERARDLTGEGVPEVVLRTWNGGAHGEFVYYIYSTGPQPRCLLAYLKNNDEDDPDHWPNLEVKDLDGAGRPEIVTSYDGFAYWCEVPQWETCYAGSARVPVVLGLRHGRFVDITSECRAWLRGKLARAKQHFLDDLHEAGEAGPANLDAQGMIEYYWVALLLSGRTTARRMVTRLLPERERSFFLENSWRLDRVLNDRSERYAYPRAYSSAQAFASEAVPPPDTTATQPGGEAAPATRGSART